MVKRPPSDWDRYNHPALHYKKPKELKRFQTALAVSASAALAFGMWSFAWYGAVAWIQSDITNWADRQRALGTQVSVAQIDTGGFPSRIVLTLQAPRYAGTLAGVPVTWSSDALVVSARPWMPWKLNVEASGRHTVAVGAGTNAVRYLGAAERLSADVELGDVWPQRLDVRVRDLQLKGEKRPDPQVLSIGRVRAILDHDPTRQAGGTGLRVNFRGRDIVLPGGLPAPLTDGFEQIEVSARVTGSVIPGPADVRIPAWRDSGGAIEFERLKIRSGSLAVDAGGTLAVDKRLQPEGAFTAKVEGLFQLFEILRAQGIMRGSEAVVATMALTALSKRPTDGGAPFINLSATLQDGMLSLGPLKIMKVPTLNWGFSNPSSPPPKAVAPPPRDYKDIKPVL